MKTLFRRGLRSLFSAAKTNPIVFFDVMHGEEHVKIRFFLQFLKDIGRIEMELFVDRVPKTAENFLALCTHEFGYGYKGSIFHRVIDDFRGDFTNSNGTGGKSIYGEKFDDEGIWLPHATAGILSMANCGPDTNGSQFFITLDPCEYLNGMHEVFGEVLNEESMEIVKAIGKIPTGPMDRPVVEVIIYDCGLLQ